MRLSGITIRVVRLILLVRLGPYAIAADGVAPETALDRLLAGNHRFTANAATHPHQDPGWRHRLAAGQHPIAAVLACSDSRVPPEILFDQGLGDLFIVRTAGHVADDVALGSLEYAVEHLGVQLIIVLGHERCGAVQAAVAGGDTSGHIGALVKHIAPAVEKVKSGGGDVVGAAVDENIRRTVAALADSGPVVQEALEGKKLSVVGLRYALDSGAVAIVVKAGPHGN